MGLNPAAPCTPLQPQHWEVQEPGTSPWSVITQHMVAASGHGAKCCGCHSAAQALRHLPHRDQPWGSAGNPGGGLGLCWGPKCNNTAALSTAPSGRAGPPRGPWDSSLGSRIPFPHGLTPLQALAEGYIMSLLPWENWELPAPRQVRGTGAGVERSACVCVFLGILRGWWVNPCVSTSMGNTASP